MSTSTPPITDAPPLSTQWQFPLLIVSLAFFATGVRRLIPDEPAPALEEELVEYRRMVASGQFDEAYEQLVQRLVSDDGTDAERGAIYQVLAATIHEAESRAPSHSAKNAERILSYLATAQRAAYRLLPVDLVRKGDAWSWLDRPRKAVELYERAVEAGIRDSADIRRRLLDALVRLDDAEPDTVDRHLDALLDDPATGATDRLWALRKKIDRLLDAGRPADGLGLIDRAAPRLVGSQHLHELDYERARCLTAASEYGEADRLLRSLREQWGPRDALWGRAGVLLARVQTFDGRPEAALSFLDEVTQAFPSGPIQLGALLARVRSFVALGRFEETT
ncbi:MAG: hypothetical protein V3T70_11540, partial [Phycisphaerae bacterium]